MVDCLECGLFLARRGAGERSIMCASQKHTRAKVVVIVMSRMMKFSGV